MSAANDRVLAERSGILTHARRYCTGVDQQLGRGTLTADEAALIKRTVNTFAGDLAIGLHVDGDDAELRAAMRELLERRAASWVS